MLNKPTGIIQFDKISFPVFDNGSVSVNYIKHLIDHHSTHTSYSCDQHIILIDKGLGVELEIELDEGSINFPKMNFDKVIDQRGKTITDCCLIEEIMIDLVCAFLTNDPDELSINDLTIVH